MLTVENWLMEPSLCTLRIGWDGPVPKEQGWTNAKTLAVLMMKNGGPRVHGWGVFRGGIGLEQDEAIYMIQITSFFDGLISGSGAQGPFHALEKELDAIAAARAEAAKPPKSDSAAHA